MSNKKETTYEKITYRNIILRILFFALVLIASFSFIFTINEKGYTEINHLISQYPQEDQSLTHLNQLRNKVYKLINLQQLEAYSNQENISEELQQDNTDIFNHLNSLKTLMKDDPERLKSIYEIDSLLESRNLIFESYLNTRIFQNKESDLKDKALEIEKILNSKVFSHDTSSRVILKYDQSLSPKSIEFEKDKEIIKPKPIINRPIIHEESKKRKFNIIPKFLRRKEKPTTEEEVKKERRFHFLPSFLRPKSKPETTVEPSKIDIEPEEKATDIKKAVNTPQIITEHTNKVEIIIDSIEIAKRDSALTQLQISLLNTQAIRHKNNIELKNQEILLLSTNDLIISQILSIIKQLEDKQLLIKFNQNLVSQNLAFRSIQVNKVILWTVAFMTIVLSFWLIYDFFKMVKIRKKLEKARNEAEFHSKAKQTFLANMSHEIRTPLQSIIGYSEILSEKEDSNEIDAINNSSKHLLHIVNEILDYDKIISGKYSFQEESFGVQDVFDDVLQICSLNPIARQLELINDYQFDVPILLGDSFRLKQILLNLLNNSLKYTEEGSVVIEARTEKNKQQVELHFSIIDTGIGISEEKLETIFNKYEQSSNEHLLKGSGLGLSIVKELIDGQNGTIEVKSTEGQGTFINVMIPFKESIAANHETDKDKVDFDDMFIDASVCFIEDDPIIQQLLKTFTNGFLRDTSFYSSAEEFLATNQLATTQCLISDIRLAGEMTGIDLIQKIRSENNSIPCIAVTAQALKEETEAILQAGFNDVLIKPFTQESLKAIILKHNQSRLTHPSKEKINFHHIQKMTSDTSILTTIMSDFYTHTLEELAQLRKLKNSELSSTILTIVHRIAGRLLQIGSTQLGNQWKTLEYQIRDKKITSTDDQRLISHIDELENEVKNWSQRKNLTDFS